MKIECLTSFLHDGDRFNAGEVRIVDDVTGEYFCRAGWVEDLSGAVETGKPKVNDTITLDIHSTQVAQSVEVK